MMSSVWIEIKSFVLINEMFQSIKMPLLLDREILLDSSLGSYTLKSCAYSVVKADTQITFYWLYILSKYIYG